MTGRNVKKELWIRKPRQLLFDHSQDNIEVKETRGVVLKVHSNCSQCHQFGLTWNKSRRLRSRGKTLIEQ